jgi:hypothetical protein
MKRMLLPAALCAMLVLASCGSSGGGIWPTPVWILKLGVLTAPAEPIVAGEAVQFKISWVDGRAPYTVRWDFADGMEPTAVTASVSENMHVADVVSVNQTDAAVEYQGLVTVTDTDGTVVSTDFSFTVQPSP